MDISLVKRSLVLKNCHGLYVDRLARYDLVITTYGTVMTEMKSALPKNEGKLHEMKAVKQLTEASEDFTMVRKSHHVQKSGFFSPIQINIQSNCSRLPGRGLYWTKPTKSEILCLRRHRRCAGLKLLTVGQSRGHPYRTKNWTCTHLFGSSGALLSTSTKCGSFGLTTRHPR